ncbi:MAG TPA: AmmeMemoRadiSam system protein B [Dehalococcoidales bacterium]|nr:AmmeMemoRadiSam system protein B [Dehalococcoidales bacterium]
MIRESVVDGQFYPGSAAQLKTMLRSFIDEKAGKEEAIGLVAPHAGYIYSGAVVGAVVSKVQIPGTVILLGPNHTGRGEACSIMTSGKWQTPLGMVPVDSELAGQLLAGSRYLKEDILAHQMEHSIEVQLPFLQYLKPDVKIIPIILAVQDPEILITLGKEIAEVLMKSSQPALIFASSDMNHYESQKTTQKKDQQAVEAMLEMDPLKLISRINQQKITMCGYGPAAVMLSAANTIGGGRAEFVKYQTSGDVSGDYGAVVGYAGIIVRKLSPLVKLAKQALETYVRNGQVIKPEKLTPEMEQKAGVFVCIKKAGKLRGCIGTFEPAQKNIAKEIIANAISTGVDDYRFEPVKSSELPDLEYSVDVLTHPEPVKDKSELNARKYGVIVQAGYRRGLLLPDLEGVDTPEQQIEICRQKGGIGEEEPVKLFRFEVKRFK